MSKSSNAFTVEIVTHRSDCLIINLPRVYVDFNLAHLGGTNSALHKLFYPVELLKNGRLEGQKEESTRLRTLGYVAASLTEPSTKSGRLQIGPQFARDLGISSGEEITVLPAYHGSQWRVASRLEIVPLNADESEVIEKNAYALQNSLMQTLRVLFIGQKVSLRTRNGVQAQVVVSSNYAEPSGVPCYVLSDGTELLVAVKGREEIKSKKTQRPKKGILRLLPRATLDSILASFGAEAKLSASSSLLSSSSISPSTIHVHPDSITNLHWQTGMPIGAINMAELPWQAANKDTSDQEAHRVPVITPSFIRLKGTRLSVVPLAPGTGKAEIDALILRMLPPNTAFINNGADLMPTNLLAKPDPEPQYGFNDVSVLISSERVTDPFNERHCVASISLENVRQVHGEAFSTQLLSLWAPTPLKSNIPSPSLNTLIVGPKGCGKTTIATVAALHSGRHLVVVDCNSNVTEYIESAIAECNLCNPSLLLLDNFGALASSHSEGGKQPTTITPTTDLMIQQWLLHSAKLKGADIIVVANVPSFEEIHPSLKLPMCFPRVLKIPPALSKDKKEVLMRQLFTASLQVRKGETFPQFTEAIVSTLVESLSGLVENYSAADLSALCSKIMRWFSLSIKPHLNPTTTTAKEIAELITPESIGAVASTYTPRSQIGIRFLSGKSEETKRAPSWDDAGGLAEAKAALHDVLVLPLKFPKLFAKLPLKTKSGVLLHGPSGCGKTYLLSVAVAAEGLHCIVVNGPEIFGKYIGTSEQKIREIFESAQAAAPCVVFFDEFDSVAPRRGNSNTGVTDRVVNQLLCYLDGVEGRKDVFVVAATSRPDLIDPALLRPGRLDRQVACPMPDHSDRKEIFMAHLRKTIPVAATDQTLGVSMEDLDELSKVTEGYTSADIAGLVSATHSQVLQSFFKLTGDALLAGLDESAQLTNTSFEAYTVDVGTTLDKNREQVAIKKIKESLNRRDNDGSISASAEEPNTEAPNTSLPKVTKGDILNALAKFNRSRESQNQEDAGATKITKSELLKKLKDISMVVGTRETSA